MKRLTKEIIAVAKIEPRILDWQRLCFSYRLPINFMREFPDYLDWEYVSSEQKLTEKFMREFYSELDWIDVSRCQSMSEEFMEEFVEYIDWDCIVEREMIGEEMVIKMASEIDFDYLISYYVITHGMIKAFQDVHGIDVGVYNFPHITPEALEMFKDELDWGSIQYNTVLSESTCIKFKDRLDHDVILEKYPDYDKFKFVTL